MKIDISVIIPVYNVEKYIDKCLNSIINQTYENIEIIIVNDGSTDNSYKIIEKYLKIDNRIKYYKKENGGQGSARNLGIRKATSKYVCFVDSDDYLPIDALEKLYNASNDGKIDIVYSSSMFCVKDNLESIYKAPKDALTDKTRFIITNAGPCNKIIKKSIIVDNNLFFPKLRFYEDLAVVPVWGLFSETILMINEPTYYYLLHDGSTMHQLKYNEKFDDIFYSMLNLSKYFKDKYHSEIEWLYISHLLHYASLRYISFNKYEQLNKIINIMKDIYPNWSKNKYFKKSSLKYKIVCYLFYNKKYLLIKNILKKGR